MIDRILKKMRVKKDMNDIQLHDALNGHCQFERGKERERERERKRRQMIKSLRMYRV